MTPDALRAAIASARLRPRMYGATTADLAAYLHGLVAGAFGGGGDTVRDAWATASASIAWRVNNTGLALTDAEVCDVALRVVAALWPQGDAALRGFRDGETPAPQVIAANARAEMDRLAADDPALASAWGDVERAALALARREGATAQPCALDLDAIEALARKRLGGCGAGDCTIAVTHECANCGARRCTHHARPRGGGCEHAWDVLGDATDHVPALVAALRAERAEVERLRDESARALRKVTGERDEAARAVGRLMADAEALTAEVAALRANIADGERIAAEVRGLFAHVDADDAPPPVAPTADDPEADGTDAAHPAWWRGQDAGCKGSLALIARLRAELARRPQPRERRMAPPLTVDFDDLFADAPVEDDNDAAQFAALARREGEAFAATHPHAAGAIMGGVAHREDVSNGSE